MNNNNIKASPVKSLENQFENLSITSFTSEDTIEIKDAIRNGNKQFNKKNTFNHDKNNYSIEQEL